MNCKKISIEGNIGCGKSTVCEAVLTNVRCPVFLEPVDKWTPYLNEFYQDPYKWGLSFNINVLLSYQEWKNNTFNAVYERSPMSCKHVFTTQQIKDGHIHPLEVSIFDKLYSQIAWEPNVIVYLQSDPELCNQRMKSRGRSCENNVSLEYLQSIHTNYEEYMDYIRQKRNDIELVVIDANQDKDTVAKQVINQINKILDN